MLANAAIGSCAANRTPAEGESAQNLAFGKKLAELMLKVRPNPNPNPSPNLNP